MAELERRHLPREEEPDERERDDRRPLRPVGRVAIEHAARGASVWPWAGNEVSIAQPKLSADRDPDVVLACAGDTPTLETVAAAWWLSRLAPELCVRVVNVIDLMTLFPPEDHPHGMSDDAFNRLFTADKPVIFAFHGYQQSDPSDASSSLTPGPLSRAWLQ